VPDASPYDYAISIGKRLFGRSLVLSYPKSGRTWILNVFLNYWWRTNMSARDPLPFLKNLKSREGQQFLKETGVSFTHGARLGHLLDGGELTLSASDLKLLPITFLVRNPVSVLVSYHHHLLQGKSSQYQCNSLREFITSPGGIDAFTKFHNRIFALISGNPRATVFAYEQLHYSVADHVSAFESLFRTHFGSVDSDALSWAILACEPQNLRSRAPKDDTRIRKAEIFAKDDALNKDLELHILDTVMKNLNPPALHYMKTLIKE
jgi:hypothetical protein